MVALYNEIEPYPAQWMRNLVEAGHIARGEVHEGSIADLEPHHVRGFTQAHFFAGLGGWSHALRLAGWPDWRAVWTGSCPCQPFSQAGRGKGFEDARHLWPTWFRLIRECQPAIVFGEQVASSDGLRWLDVVSSDLEGAGYAVAAADLCAGGVGAPHLRQRLYFVAFSTRIRLQGRHFRGGGVQEESHGLFPPGPGTDVSAMAHSHGIGHHLENGYAGGGGHGTGPLAHPHHLRAGAGGPYQAPGAAGGVQGEGNERKRIWTEPGASGGAVLGPAWAGAHWVECLDGKARAFEPGAFPLAHGVPARVGRLRAYGNAIVPQVAALFIRSVMDLLEEKPSSGP